MNNKIEIAIGKHIERLETGVKTKQSLKMIALLREGVIPKYSDLFSEGVEIVMGEFVNLLELVDESAAATRDLDLIDYGKELGREIGKAEAKLAKAGKEPLSFGV